MNIKDIMKKVSREEELKKNLTYQSVISALQLALSLLNSNFSAQFTAQDNVVLA